MSEQNYSRESISPPTSPPKKRNKGPKAAPKPLEKKKSPIPNEFVTYMKSAFFSLSEEVDLYYIQKKWNKRLLTSEMNEKQDLRCALQKALDLLENSIHLERIEETLGLVYLFSMGSYKHKSYPSLFER